MSTDDSFWARVDKSGDCWVWTAYRTPSGYGQVGINGRVLLTHRVAWTLVNGPIPDGLHMLHRCDNPPCCNPAHLFLGTNADNVADRMAKGRHKTNGYENRTHCPQGHPYDEGNTYVTPRGSRNCRACGRAATQAWSRRKKASA